jgi:putative ABC transport system ATP-binding protein
MEPLIVCENLVKIYPLDEVEIVALQGLDLAVEKGEMLGIVGASGSGKTTLLNVLGGLDRPSAGKVRVGESDLLKMSEAELDGYRRAQVGFVWQQTARNLIPYLTALENVELPMRLSDYSSTARRRRARELLEALGLENRLHHHPARLSGGEQQRVAIAVALANRPLILLADEPTGEVDTATAQEVLTALRAMNRLYGMTTLIVSHDPNIGLHTDRVIAIRDGKTSTETFFGGEGSRAVRQGQGDQGVLGTAQPGLGKPVEERPAPETVELAVLDSAGRVQIPRQYLETLDIGDRVRLELQEQFIAVHPVAGRSRPGHADGETQPDLVALYVEEDQAPDPLGKSLPDRIRGILRRVGLTRRVKDGSGTGVDHLVEDVEQANEQETH